MSLLVLAGCAPLDAAEAACDEFAAHARDGMPADDRPEVVRSMGEVIGDAPQPLQDGHAGLVRTVGGSDSAYRLAADTFAQACFDLGWNG